MIGRDRRGQYLELMLSPGYSSLIVYSYQRVDSGAAAPHSKTSRRFVAAREITRQRLGVRCCRTAFRLRMRNDQQCLCPGQHTLQRAAEILRVQRGEALVEHDQLRALEQGAGDVEPALLAMR